MAVTDYFDASFDVNGQDVNITIYLKNGFYNEAYQTASSVIGPPCSGPAPAPTSEDQTATTQSWCFTGEIRFAISFKKSDGTAVKTVYTKTVVLTQSLDGTTLTAQATDMPYDTYDVTVTLQGGANWQSSTTQPPATEDKGTVTTQSST